VHYRKIVHRASSRYPNRGRLGFVPTAAAPVALQLYKGRAQPSELVSGGQIIEKPIELLPGDEGLSGLPPC